MSIVRLSENKKDVKSEEDKPQTNKKKIIIKGSLSDTYTDALNETMAKKSYPIINDNDSVSPSDLMGTDHTIESPKNVNDVIRLLKNNGDNKNTAVIANESLSENSLKLLRMNHFKIIHSPPELVDYIESI